ncbi:hypothetical protein DHEL01_v203690 [Diaporthe helianthi]|uniref:Uncharacterized protein n=1 Tax=Diaporthe helianthi TaxID=158607 RepID=A0A2P5I5Z6_DIAHE|nr:hypothetical protein DHEL01_v203690 [Diaporthe helianthi]
MEGGVDDNTSLTDPWGPFSDYGLGPLSTDADHFYPDEFGITEQAESGEILEPWNNGTSGLDPFDLGYIDPLELWLSSDGARMSIPAQDGPGQAFAGVGSVDGSQVVTDAL